jgi:hypothetical protein
MSQDRSHHRLQIIMPKIVVTGYSTRTEIFQNWDGPMILSRGSRPPFLTFPRESTIIIRMDATPGNYSTVPTT